MVLNIWKISISYFWYALQIWRFGSSVFILIEMIQHNLLISEFCNSKSSLISTQEYEKIIE